MGSDVEIDDSLLPPFLKTAYAKHKIEMVLKYGCCRTFYERKVRHALEKLGIPVPPLDENHTDISSLPLPPLDNAKPDE